MHDINTLVNRVFANRTDLGKTPETTQNQNWKSMHFSLSLVVNNVDLLSCILEFIDPQYLDVSTVNIVRNIDIITVL